MTYENGHYKKLAVLMNSSAIVKCVWQNKIPESHPNTKAYNVPFRVTGSNNGEVNKKVNLKTTPSTVQHGQCCLKLWTSAESFPSV